MSVLCKFEVCSVKTVVDATFRPEGISKKNQAITATVGRFLKFFFHKFLIFIKGFQNIYGYGGLKLQTKKKVGGGYPPKKTLKIIKKNNKLVCF